MNRLLPFLGTLSLICLVSLSYAQPTITAAANPQVGDRWEATMLDFNSFDPGPTGPNQTWDFSMVPTQAGFPPFEFSVLDTQNAPMSAAFPNASYVMKWDLIGFQFYQYEFTDNQTRATLGGVVFDNGTVLSQSTYLNDDNAVQYPLIYQKTYSFTATEQTVVTGFTLNSFIDGEVTIDGYGTLKLPNATYQDVLRMTIKRIKVDTIFAGIVERDTSFQHLWMQEGNGLALLVYEYSLDVDGGEPTLYYSKKLNSSGLFSTAATPAIPITLFPNPVQDRAFLVTNAFGMHEHVEVNLMNLQGQRVKQLYIGTWSGDELSLDLSLVHKGFYWVEVKGEDGQKAVAKVVVE